MLTIIFYRSKCIGCNSCVLVCPLFFIMSKKDGKSILLRSIIKKNIYILKNINNIFKYNLKKASEVCPVNIIKIIKF